MTIFKWLKNGKLYILYKGTGKVIAIPFEHNDSVLTNPNLSEFIPIKTGNGLNGFV